MNKMRIVIFILSNLLFLSANSYNYYPTTAQDDEIKFLPGLKTQPTFKHYSGYLQVTSKRFLHYWFVESQSSPIKDPLVIWFNGGPGCSSLDGLLTEHGPYLVTNKGSLEYNPYAWNKIANVLYLEAPAGVGFSYDLTNNSENNDDQVADENYIALMQFFLKFPQFVKNDFFISGESYAGIYIPTLTMRVLSNATINFKGILVGNGLSSYSINSNSLLYFAYYHGLFGQKLWDAMLTECCPGLNDTDVCPFDKGQRQKPCESEVNKGINILNNGLNTYNLYAPCYGGIGYQPPGSQRFNFMRMGYLFHNNLYAQLLKENMDPPCTNSTASFTYLNDPIVRLAIHVNNPFVPTWEICSDEIYSNYQRTYSDMFDTYNSILAAKKIRILIYNGDVDMACNFIGDEWFFDSLKLPIDTERRAWLFTDVDGSRQIAGFTKSWTNNLTYSTIRGAGHMVPTDTPIQAFAMFQRFINNQPL